MIAPTECVAGDPVEAAPVVRKGREVSVDWCEVSVKTVTLGTLFGWMEKHLGAPFGKSGVTVLRDDEKLFSAKGPLGLKVSADRVGQEDLHGNREPWVGLRMPGELCRAVGTEAVLDLVEVLGRAGRLKVSRVDLALDDFDKTFSPRKFALACVDGSLDDEGALLGPGAVTRVRRDNWEWSRRDGGCFWLGGRSSARLLRVYDKDRESGGQIPSTRIELQCRDEFATALMGRVLRARREKRSMGEVFAEEVVAFVDLREPDGSRSSSQKWRRVRWWRKVVGDAKGVVTPAADDSGVLPWVRAMRRQCSGFLGVVLRALGVTEEGFRKGDADAVVARKCWEAMRAIVGKRLEPLSAEHEVRLGQLVSESERQRRFLEKWRR